MWVEVDVRVGGNGVYVSVGGKSVAVRDGVKVNVTLGLTWVGCSVGSEGPKLHPYNNITVIASMSIPFFDLLLIQDLILVITGF